MKKSGSNSQKNKSVECVFKERLVKWKKSQLKTMTLTDQLDFRDP
jgi:hypothetical protein